MRVNIYVNKPYMKHQTYHRLPSTVSPHHVAEALDASVRACVRACVLVRRGTNAANRRRPKYPL